VDLKHQPGNLLENFSTPTALDVFRSTECLPPWGIFSFIAQEAAECRPNPVPLRQTIPDVFLFEGINQTLSHWLYTNEAGLIAAKPKEATRVDLMEMSLLRSYSQQHTEEQPFVCTVYLQHDWVPRFVDRRSFGVLIDQLRTNEGQTVAGYEPEAALALFPSEICCVQTYLPIGGDLRLLCLYMRSPVDVACDTLPCAFPTATCVPDEVKRRLRRRVQKEVVPVSGTVAAAAKRSASNLTAYLRTSHHIRVACMVCQYLVSDNTLFLTGCLRASRGQFATGESNSLISASKVSRALVPVNERGEFEAIADLLSSLPRVHPLPQLGKMRRSPLKPRFRALPRSPPHMLSIKAYTSHHHRPPARVSEHQCGSQGSETPHHDSEAEELPKSRVRPATNSSIGNFECYRCGDLFQAPTDCPGFIHSGWRSGAHTTRGRYIADQTEPKTPLVRSGRDTFRTICSICLQEVGADFQNRLMVRQLLQTRTDGGAVAIGMSYTIH